MSKNERPLATPEIMPMGNMGNCPFWLPCPLEETIQGQLEKFNKQARIAGVPEKKSPRIGIMVIVLLLLGALVAAGFTISHYQ